MLDAISVREPIRSIRPSRTSMAALRRIESSFISPRMRGRGGPAKVTSSPQFITANGLSPGKFIELPLPDRLLQRLDIIRWRAVHGQSGNNCPDNFVRL